MSEQTSYICFVQSQWVYDASRDIREPCIGCYVTSCFDDYPFTEMADGPGLTESEKEILYLTKQLTNKYLELSDKLPTENSEFCQHVHALQCMLALRVARRVDTDIWKIPEV